ncbi:hypothetical protein KVP97_20880 [Escherichia coli]|nr:hypothetical protein [Escherichia coli]
MATILTTDYDLLSVPFSVATDFTTLAGYCDRVAETLIECRDPVLKMALCGRLSACLALLRPTLNEPLPPHLLDDFIADKLPDAFPCFEPDETLLCDYCQVLTQILTEQTLLPETEKTLIGLMCELVWFFSDGLKAPR